jgi:hypothetical protein
MQAESQRDRQSSGVELGVPILHLSLVVLVELALLGLVRRPIQFHHSHIDTGMMFGPSSRGFRPQGADEEHRGGRVARARRHDRSDPINMTTTIPNRIWTRAACRAGRDRVCANGMDDRNEFLFSKPENAEM